MILKNGLFWVCVVGEADRGREAFRKRFFARVVNLARAYDN